MEGGDFVTLFGYKVIKYIKSEQTFKTYKKSLFVCILLYNVCNLNLENSLNI